MTRGHQRLGQGFEEIRLRSQGRLLGVFRRHFAGVDLVEDLLPSVREFHGIQHERDFVEAQLAFLFLSAVAFCAVGFKETALFFIKLRNWWLCRRCAHQKSAPETGEHARDRHLC